MEIHDKIRVMREINQWSQEEMAEKLKMSPTGYAKIERGKTNITLDKLEQIAQIFNIDLVELIAKQDKAFFFSIGDNTSNHQNIGSTNALIIENEKLKALLDSKEELLKQKDREIDALKQIIELLRNN